MLLSSTPTGNKLWIEKRKMPRRKNQSKKKQMMKNPSITDYPMVIYQEIELDRLMPSDFIPIMRDHC